MLKKESFSGERTILILSATVVRWLDGRRTICHLDVSDDQSEIFILNANIFIEKYSLPYLRKCNQFCNRVPITTKWSFVDVRFRN